MINMQQGMDEMKEEMKKKEETKTLELPEYYPPSLTLPFLMRKRLKALSLR